VVDHDKSALSRDYLHRYIDSRYFDYLGDLASEREIGPMLADSGSGWPLLSRHGSRKI